MAKTKGPVGYHPAGSVVLVIAVYIGVLTALNMRAIKSVRIGGPHAASEYRTRRGALPSSLSSVRKLRSLEDFVEVFYAADGDDGDHDPRVLPHGVYVGEQLPLGLSWLAGAGQISRYLMGGSGGAWAGKWFGGPDAPTEGGNMFAPRGGDGAYRGHWSTFLVRSDHASALDGRPAVQLDYAASPHAASPFSWPHFLFQFMRDEVRCIHADLCVGFGGFTFTGGVANGSPFVLYRQ